MRKNYILREENVILEFNT